MKRILSLLLAMVLILGTIPVAARAAAPAESNGVYQIETAEELFWFAEKVNGGETGISAVLMADIDLSKVTTWPGIGTSGSKYAGTFDGQNHTVTFQDAKWGLFGYVEGKSGALATIKNVKTIGTIKHSAIAHRANFAHIENCFNGATITCNESYVAGIVGDASGVRQGNGTTANELKLIRCGNEASVTGFGNVGGILGYGVEGVTMDNCYNLGNIHGADNVGGLAGYLQNSCSVKNSYNTGRVTGTSAVAGIVGYQMNDTQVTNCYNAGNTFHAISGERFNQTSKIVNSYFLGTASAKTSPDYNQTLRHDELTKEIQTRAIAMTAADMASEEVVGLLGSAFKQSCPTPVLSWQEVKAHTGDVCENCGLGSTVKEIYDVSFQEHDGYTLVGEDKATQYGTYSFTISISEGYEAVSGFAVKVNGEPITAASDGKYTVLQVTGPISVTVLNVKVIPGNHSITLPGEGYGYRVTGAKTVKRDQEYTFNLSFVNGFKAGKNFKVIAQEILPQEELDKGTVPYEQEVSGQNGVYTIPAVQKDYRILVSGVEAVSSADPVTVSFTVTEGFNEFHALENNYAHLMDQTITVPYFDLSLYGLEKYYYNPYCYVDENGTILSRQQKGTPESAYNNITVMHAFIVATEIFYLGYGPSQVGTGDPYSKNPGAFKKAISWSQDAGSSFMNFWDHGSNLNYYVNYQYPLAYPGWGATSDQILLKDGDIISVHMITGQGSGSNFGFFAYDNDDGKYKPGDTNIDNLEVDQGQKVKLQYFWTATSGSYNTSYKKQSNKKLYWINAKDVSYMDVNVKNWSIYEDADGSLQEAPFGKNTLVTDSDGRITIDTSGIAPGTYYIGGLGGFTDGGGKDDAGFVSAGYEAGPSFFRLTINEYNGKTGDVDGDTQITALDATVILQAVAGSISKPNDAIADVDNDGKTTALDATAILQYVAGTITQFPADSE